MYHNGLSLWILLIFIVIAVIDEGADARGGRGGGGRGGGGRGGGSRGGYRGGSRSSSSGSKGFFGGRGTKTRTYSGGGRSVHTSSPYVSQKTLQGSYFNPIIVPMIFMSRPVYYGGHYGSGYHGSAAGVTTYSNSNLDSNPLTNDTETDLPPPLSETSIYYVAEPEKPVMIAKDLAFFWDEKFLPDKNETECVQFETSNAQGNITFCNVTNMSRCSRPINESTAFSDRKIMFNDKESPSNISWLCPKDQSCCDWECCSSVDQEDDEINPLEIFVIIAIVVVVITFKGIKSQCDKRQNDVLLSENQRRIRNNPQPPYMNTGGRLSLPQRNTQLQFSSIPLNPIERNAPPQYTVKYTANPR